MQERDTNEEIADMGEGTPLPRKNGEIVFHNEWERRAFAIAVSLAESGHYKWREFQQQLIAAIGDAEKDDPLNPSRGYFESWLVSLENILDEKELLKNDPE